jgi:hypothetical protein
MLRKVVAVAPGFIWLNFLSGLFLGGGRTTVNLGLTVPQPPPPTLLSQLICSATGCGGLKSPTDLAILGSPLTLNRLLCLPGPWGVTVLRPLARPGRERGVEEANFQPVDCGIIREQMNIRRCPPSILLALLAEVAS